MNKYTIDQIETNLGKGSLPTSVVEWVTNHDYESLELWREVNADLLITDVKPFWLNSAWVPLVISKDVIKRLGAICTDKDPAEGGRRKVVGHFR